MSLPSQQLPCPVTTRTGIGLSGASGDVEVPHTILSFLESAFIIGETWRRGMVISLRKPIVFQLVGFV
jgi:hypothetical protein